MGRKKKDLTTDDECIVNGNRVRIRIEMDQKKYLKLKLFAFIDEVSVSDVIDSMITPYIKKRIPEVVRKLEEE